MPPHNELKIPPHALPVRTENKLKFIFFSSLFSTLFTTFFALAMKFFGIPINVILPSSAPIWMGLLTLGYMVQTEKEKYGGGNYAKTTT